jgi:hypothetical protein
MSNTLGGINLTVIAQDSLTTLLAEFPLVSKFTTNFGGEIATIGETVKTRVASAVEAADIKTGGYAAGAVTSTEKVVSLDNHRGFVMGFNDGEVAKGGYEMLRRTFIRPAAHAVSKAVLDDIFALVTPSNFNTVGTSGVSFEGTIAEWDADAVADVSQTLTDKNVAQAGRLLIVRPRLYTALAKDNAIQAQYASGTNAPLTENLLPRIHGFEVNQYSALPYQGALKANGDVNTLFANMDDNLYGVAVSPEAFIIATRQPATPSNWYGNVASATDEKSGLTVQVREWYDGDSGLQKISMSILYGVAVGQKNCLGRILINEA